MLFLWKHIPNYNYLVATASRKYIFIESESGVPLSMVQLHQGQEALVQLHLLHC